MRICALQIFASIALACIPMDRVATAEDRRSHATSADQLYFVTCPANKLASELWKRLRFGEPDNFIPASATAS